MQPETQATREDRWIAALCHLSTTIVLFGMLVPLITYITQKDRSPYLRFQALQALIYQGIGYVAYLIFNIFTLVIYLVIMIPMIIITESSAAGDPAAAFLIFLFVLVMLVLMVFYAVLVPLYIILALYATLRTGQGHNYAYPLLGRLLRPKQPVSPVV